MNGPPLALRSVSHGEHNLADARSARLKNAARQFEASFLNELTRPLQEKGALFSGGTEDSETGSEDALSGYGSEAFAKALSDRGGFGIARKIIDELGRVTDRT